jgi:hypothetical protein
LVAFDRFASASVAAEAERSNLGSGRRPDQQGALRNAEEADGILKMDGPGGEFPLFWAAASGSFSILRNLIAAGADVSKCTASNWKAPHAAAHHNHSGLVKELLKSEDADMDGITSGYEAPLHLAAARGHGAVVKVLLKENADITMTNLAGKTALELAERGALAGCQAVARGALETAFLPGVAQFRVGRKFAVCQWWCSVKARTQNDCRRSVVLLG